MRNAMVNSSAEIVKTSDNGAVPVTKRRYPPSGVLTNLRVPLEEVEAWRAAAAADKRSLTSLIRHVMDIYLAMPEPRP